VRWLLKERKNWPEYEKEYRDLVESYANAANSTEGGRLAQCYAALQFTETLAIAAGVTPWSSSKDIESLWLDIAAEAKDAAGEVRALMDIMSWAGSNEHRFDGREVRDRDETIRAPIQGYAGRWDPDDSEPWSFIGFFPTVLKKVLDDLGYEYEAILTGWREKGWLMVKDGEKRYTRKVRTNGESQWLVTISRGAVKAAEEA
jgi:hypothetical protein